MKLTKNEKTIFKALIESSYSNGGDFGFIDEVDYESLGYNKFSYPGIVGSLIKKGLINSDECTTYDENNKKQKFQQVTFNKVSIPFFKEVGMDWKEHDHLHY